MADLAPGDLSPLIVAVISSIPETEGWLDRSPVAYPIFAESYNGDSDKEVDGRYVAPKGAAVGTPTPLRIDTTLVSGKNTGDTYDLISGTCRDDSSDPQYDTFRLYFPDGTAGAGAEVIEHDSSPTLDPVEILLSRGYPPSGGSYSATDNYAYLEFGYGSSNKINYRFVANYALPLRMQYSKDGGVTWQESAIAQKLGHCEQYLAAHNNLIRLRLWPDKQRGVLDVEIGDGEWLHHAPELELSPNDPLPPDFSGNLPTDGKIRLRIKNGWAAMSVFPTRHSDVTTTVPELDLGEVHPNAGDATVSTNSLYPPSTNQTVFTDYDPNDNQTVKLAVTASLPDNGDTTPGSVDPPVLADTTLVIPAVWTDHVPGGFPDEGSELLLSMEDSVLHTWDDATRTISSSASLTANNWWGKYANAFRHQHIEIWATNGGNVRDMDGNLLPAWWPQFYGIAGVGTEGLSLFRRDPANLLGIPCRDNSYKLMVPIGYEVLFDGWCIYSAVRFVCEACSVHPAYLRNIPLYIPPGASADAPYGKAGQDCPYPVLEEGSGLNAKHKYLPDMLGWDILQKLVLNTGQPIDGNPIPDQPDQQFLYSLPFYMGFVFDQFLFQAYDPSQLTPVALFADDDPFNFLESFEVYNSVDQMRTSVDFQGIDHRTYHLLQYHRPTHPYVQQAIGFRSPWLERDPRYGDKRLVIGVAEAAVAQCSLPQQMLRFQTLFRPDILPGQLIQVYENTALQGLFTFVVNERLDTVGLADKYGGPSGIQNCKSVFTCRRVENFVQSPPPVQNPLFRGTTFPPYRN